MIKEKIFLSLNLIIIILLFNLVSTAQEPEKKARIVRTNDEFSTDPPKDKTTENPKVEESSALSNNPSNPSSNPDNTASEKVPDVELLLKSLDLQLALAQEPDNQLLRQQQIDINTQIRQSSLVQPSAQELKDLTFRQRYVTLKINLVNLDKEIQSANAGVQQQRRRIIKGSQGNSAFEGVREAEDKAEALSTQRARLQMQLDTLIEEGRRLGVSPRVYR